MSAKTSKANKTDEDPFGSAPFPYKSLSNFNGFINLFIILLPNYYKTMCILGIDESIGSSPIRKMSLNGMLTIVVIY